MDLYILSLYCIVSYKSLRLLAVVSLGQERQFSVSSNLLSYTFNLSVLGT